MKRLSSILAILLFLGFIPISCKKNAGGCGDTDHPKTFRMKTMETQSVLIRNLVPLDTSLSYSAADIAIRLYPKDVEFYTELRNTMGFSFVNEAMACSPAEPTATQHIQQIEIINQTDSLMIDSMIYPRAATINFCFQMKINDRQTFLSLKDFVALKEKIRHGDSYLLQFHKVLQTPTKLKFDIKITMNDGTGFYLFNQQLKVQ
jgi:hypothetical protein